MVVASVVFSTASAGLATEASIEMAAVYNGRTPIEIVKPLIARNIFEFGLTSSAMQIGPTTMLINQYVFW